jgi:hypothetical protein
MTSVQELIDLKLCHEIHTSERKSFRGCRRRWDWIFHDHYYPLTTAKPLEFGVAFHAGMEVYYDPDTWTWDREVVGNLAIQKFVDVCHEQKRNALEANSQLGLDVDAETDYNERVELGIGMMNYYFKKISPEKDYQNGWKPVKVEVKFMVAIPNPETGEEAIWCKCNECWEKFQKWDGYAEWRTNCEDLYKQDSLGATMSEAVHEALYREECWEGLPVVYAGRCDMIAIDKHDNVWIFDWKTARTCVIDHEFLYIDDQVGSYVWALRKLGIKVAGFVYVEIRKGFPMDPARNKVNRLGRWYSVAKNQDTDYETYLKCVMENDFDAFEQGAYDDFLQYLKVEGTIFSQRIQIPKTPQEREEIERNIGFEALDMVDPKLRIYPSAGRFSCSTCAFKEPCMEKNNQGDYVSLLDTFFEQREHYYVRQEASTETKGGE